MNQGDLPSVATLGEEVFQFPHVQDEGQRFFWPYMIPWAGEGGRVM
jgi:hypothetical protein